MEDNKSKLEALAKAMQNARFAKNNNPSEENKAKLTAAQEAWSAEAKRQKDEAKPSTTSAPSAEGVKQFYGDKGPTRD